MKYINTIAKEVAKVNKEVESTNALINSLYKETSKGETQNGAVTFTRSGSALLDFFAQGGAMRKSQDAALDLFKKAYAEDAEKAIRILFYLRDVRGGQGERDLFRNCLQYIGATYPEVFNKIVGFVPEYGRWDDMFFDNDKCIEILKNTLIEDSLTTSPSLLAKWMPTINASSEITRNKARFFAKKFGMLDIQYRKLIRAIRKKLETVEEKMSARKWEDINYPSVPSQASRIYKDAFKKHDEKRYGAFVDKAATGEVKINASTLYPYQIYKDVNNGNNSKTLEALWSQLPDYTRGTNALVVADVSGSMHGDPMSVSVSLALYFAERNKGAFKDHFITFSQNPVLQRIVGADLKQKMNSIERAQWDMNTDLLKVFQMILNTAVSNNVPATDMPETLYIISDMEFDQACSYNTTYEKIEQAYGNHSYKVPNIVFWNVNASGKNLPVQKGKKGVSMVSGFSPSIFKLAVENKNAEEVMMDVINSERYNKIVL